MITSKDSGPLTDRDWGRLNDQCEALERAWREAEDDFVDLRRFLPPAEDPLRRRSHHRHGGSLFRRMPGEWLSLALLPGVGCGDGYYDGHAAPFDHAGPGLLAIKLNPEVFWDVGLAKGNESCYHCRDMGGNGYEWTWNVRPDRDEPFTFAMLRKDQRLVNYGDAPEDTSFRVVLPLDE